MEKGGIHNSIGQGWDHIGVYRSRRGIPMLSVGQAFQDPSGAFDEVIRSGRRKHNYLPEEVMGE